MTHIRVDVEQLRLKADELESAAESMRTLADHVLASAESAPSYDGQFGPKVVGLAEEGRAALVSRAQQLTELSADLRARAQAFEEADREFHEALAGINRRGQYPLTDIQWGEPNQEPPWWLVELIIGMVPFGDVYDIVKELIRLITSGEADTLILILAALGLCADIGWADGPVPDPVDGANADEAPAFFATLHILIKNDEILDVLKDNPRALAAILDSGPEAVELLAKNEEVALALIKHEEVAAALIKNAEYLDEIVQGGPEAVEQLLKYGDDYAARFLDAVPENGLAMRVAGRYDIDFYQARVSSGKAEVDVFIPKDQWELLTNAQKEDIATRIARTFDLDPDDVDFYQELDSLPLDDLGIPSGRYSPPDPATSVPPGSIRFGSSGTISHPTLGNLGGSGP